MSTAHSSGLTLEWTERACPLCSSSKVARVFAESNLDPKGLTQFTFASRKLPEYMHPRLVECADCEMLYGNPVLSEGLLSSLYLDAAFDSQEESHLASFVYKRILERHLSKLKDRHGAIDIGAGDGAFCERLLDLGFSDVIGIEPSAAPIAAAKAEIQKLLAHRIFRSEDFMPNSVSLVSCFQVMEHVPAPLEIASAAFRVLKRNGLFLVVVHDQRALSAQVLGLKSPIYDIEHLQLFTKDTGRKLLERAGFEHVQVSPLWNRYPLQYWMRLFPFPSGIKDNLISLVRSSGLGTVQVSLPPGNIVLAGFKL